MLLARTLLIVAICSNDEHTQTTTHRANKNRDLTTHAQITEYNSKEPEIDNNEIDYEYSANSRQDRHRIPWGESFGSQGNDPEVKINRLTKSVK